jgi:hypothetical protein
MTATERKRMWREKNPERSREAERVRAQARRQHGSYIQIVGEDGKPAYKRFVYPSGESYQRYESNGYPEAQVVDRMVRGVGRLASRWRSYMKDRRRRSAANREKYAMLCQVLADLDSKILKLAMEERA